MQVCILDFWEGAIPLLAWSLKSWSGPHAAHCSGKIANLGRENEEKGPLTVLFMM
jgi:hypothetical protein